MKAPSSVRTHEWPGAKCDRMLGCGMGRGDPSGGGERSSIYGGSFGAVGAQRMLGAHWVPIGHDTESRIRVVGGNETVAMVEIKNLNKWFWDHHVLRDITMEVEHGEVVSVIGPDKFPT